MIFDLELAFVIAAVWTLAVLVIWSVLAAGKRADERTAESLSKLTRPTGLVSLPSRDATRSTPPETPDADRLGSQPPLRSVDQ